MSVGTMDNIEAVSIHDYRLSFEHLSHMLINVGKMLGPYAMLTCDFKKRSELVPFGKGNFKPNIGDETKESM